MNTVELQGSQEKISVGKILCVGRNYAQHAKEMKADVPESPVFFLKPPTAIIQNGGSVVLPSVSKDVHHEVELTVLIGTGGKNIPQDKALSHVAGYGVGLDMTLRDVQSEAKKKGLPWTLAKGFDTSAPLSQFVPASSVENPSTLGIRLSVNGNMRQTAKISSLIFPVDFMIAHISQVITLERGDVLYTGTPEGVAQVHSGDNLEAVLLDSREKIIVSLSVRVQ